MARTFDFAHEVNAPLNAALAGINRFVHFTNELQDLLLKSNIANKELQEHYMRLKAEGESAEMQIAELTKFETLLRAQVQARDESIAKCEQEKAELRQWLESTEKELGSQHERLATVQKEREEAMAQLSSANTRNTSVTDQLTLSTTELTELRAKYDSLAEEVKEMRSKNDSLEKSFKLKNAQYTEKSEEARSIRKSYADLHKEKDTLEEQTAVVKEQLEKAEANGAKLVMLRGEDERSIKRLKDRVGQLLDDKRDLRDQKRAHDKEIERLKAECNEKGRTIQINDETLRKAGEKSKETELKCKAAQTNIEQVLIQLREASGLEAATVATDDFQPMKADANPRGSPSTPSAVLHNGLVSHQADGKAQQSSSDARNTAPRDSASTDPSKSSSATTPTASGPPATSPAALTQKRPRSDAHDTESRPEKRITRKAVCRLCLRDERACSSFGRCKRCNDRGADCVYNKCPKGDDCRQIGCSKLHPGQWGGEARGKWEAKDMDPKTRRWL